MADEQQGAEGTTRTVEGGNREPRRGAGRKILRGIGIALGVLVVAIGGFALYVQATYVRTFDSTPLPAIKASTDPEVIKRGAYVAHSIAHCSACHLPEEFAHGKALPTNLDDVRGGYAMHAGPFGTFYPANLTPDPETGIGKLSDGELARVIRSGVGPQGRYDPIMSFAVGPMADEDLTAVVSYLRSIPPVKNATKNDEWGFVAKALSSKFGPSQYKTPPFVKEGGISVERGLYIAKGPGVCFVCHSPFDAASGFKLSGAEFSGGFEADADETDSGYEIMAPNLTTDPTSGLLTSFTEDAFVDRFKKAGRAVKGSPMPWENFARMNEDDLRSIYRFLKSVPPVKRSTGPTRRARGSWKG